jgi:hypothetical protein
MKITCWSSYCELFLDVFCQIFLGISYYFNTIRRRLEDYLILSLSDQSILEIFWLFLNLGTTRIICRNPVTVPELRQRSSFYLDLSSMSKRSLKYCETVLITWLLLNTHLKSVRNRFQLNNPSLNRQQLIAGLFQLVIICPSYRIWLLTRSNWVSLFPARRDNNVL